MNSPSVGEQLKQTRVALQLSLQDVTQATKIQPWVLEQLEADRLHTTMSPVYTKGFLSSYARFLRLDHQPLIARLYPEPPPESVEPAAVSSPPTPEGHWPLESLWPILRRLGTALVGVAVIVGVVAINPLRWVAPRLPRQEASLSVVKERPVPAQTSLNLQPTQPLELTIAARRSTWIVVKGDGRLLAQQELESGSKETWTARRRFEVVIARPAQVELWLNGQPISPLAMAHAGRLAITHTSIKALAHSSTEEQ